MRYHINAQEEIDANIVVEIYTFGTWYIINLHRKWAETKRSCLKSYVEHPLCIIKGRFSQN